MGQGILIAFEGIDGAGLTTQATRARANLEKRPLLRGGSDEEPITYLTKEPTNGPVGGEIREVLSGRLDVNVKTLALMFAADRQDHSEEEINKMIDRGKIVIVDRYYLSSLAYQGLEINDMEWLREINSKCRTPDLTLFIDVSATEAKKRMNQDRLTTEIYETESQLRDVRESYQDAIEMLSDSENEDIRVVDGEESKDIVERRIMRHIHEKIEQLNMR